MTKRPTFVRSAYSNTYHLYNGSAGRIGSSLGKCGVRIAVVGEMTDAIRAGWRLCNECAAIAKAGGGERG